MARVSFFLGNFGLSTKYFKKALGMFIEMGNPNNTIKAFVTILNFADYLKDKTLQEYAINKVKNDFEGNENATTALQEILNEFNMT